MSSVKQQVARDAVDESAEEAQIRRWRFAQFVRLGFREVDSAMMTDARVDLNQVRELVAHGCPRETVTRIVL
jgi:hypothetical protein